MATSLGLGATFAEPLATAVSELAWNILVHAGKGEIVLQATRSRQAKGITVLAVDQGPGIAETSLALEDGYSTSGGLGLGLPSARRLVDEFELVSAVGMGTTVRLTKWAE